MRKKPNEGIQALLSTVVMLYFLSTSAMGMYYNYQYARENGFVRWIFLGEIVPTAKGFVWPYFVWRDRHQQQTKQENSASHEDPYKEYKQAISPLADEFFALSKEQDIPMSKEDKAQGIQHFVAKYIEWYTPIRNREILLKSNLEAIKPPPKFAKFHHLLIERVDYFIDYSHKLEDSMKTAAQTGDDEKFRIVMSNIKTDDESWKAKFKDAVAELGPDANF